MATPTSPAQANKELLLKAIVLILIGLGVLLGPAYMQPSGLRNAMAGSSIVGWFGLALGIAFLGQWAWRRGKR